MKIDTVKQLIMHIFHKCYDLNSQRPVFENPHYLLNGLPPFVHIDEDMIESTSGNVFLIKLPKGYRIAKEE